MYGLVILKADKGVLVSNKVRGRHLKICACTHTHTHSHTLLCPSQTHVHISAKIVRSVSLTDGCGAGATWLHGNP